MNYSFSIEERILIYSLLPQQGDYLLLKECLAYQDTIRFTEEEVRNYDISHLMTEDGRMQVTFNKEVAEGDPESIRSFKTPALLASHIAEQLGDLDRKKALTIQLLSLYEKFVLGDVEVKEEESAKPSKSSKKSEQVDVDADK